MTKKYEFTGETKEHDGIKLNRIRRLSDGLVGGWIEKESNLSHQGDCFVYGNARVDGNAAVYGNARVYGNTLVFGNARVYGNAQVFGNAYVYGDAHVSGNAAVYGNALVYGYAHISSNARVDGNAAVSGNARVDGNALVYGYAHISSNAQVFGNAFVSKTPICISGYKHHITITETHIFVGCEGHTIEHWKKNIKALGLANSYSEEEIKQIIRLLKAHLPKIKKGAG